MSNNDIYAFRSAKNPNDIIARDISQRCLDEIFGHEPATHGHHHGGRQPLHDHGRAHITILPDGRVLVEEPEYVVAPQITKPAVERELVEARADAGFTNRAIRDARLQADKVIEDARNKARNNLALLLALLDDDD